MPDPSPFANLRGTRACIDVGGPKVAVSIASAAGIRGRVVEPTVKQGARDALGQQLLRLVDESCKLAGVPVAEVHAPMFMQPVLRPIVAHRTHLDQQAPAHAEMDERTGLTRAIEFQQQVLRPPRDAGAHPPDQALERRLRHRPPQVLAAQLHRDQPPPAQQRFSASAHGFDFRQFWHGVGEWAAKDAARRPRRR